jgi:putative DNA primase/helicase
MSDRSKLQLVKPGQPPPDGDLAALAEAQASDHLDPFACSDVDLLDHRLHELPTTDHGNALRLYERFGDRIRYVPVWNRWFVWDGRRWREDPGGKQVKWLARHVALKVFCEANTLLGHDSARAEQLSKWCFASQSNARLEATIAVATSEKRLHVVPDEIDRHENELNVENGLLHLLGGVLQPHDPARLITALAPVRWEGDQPCRDAECPWEQLVERALPDPDVRDFLQRYCAYAVSGRSNAKLSAFLHGPPDTSKTTLVEILRAVLGVDYAVEVAKTLFVVKERSHDHHPTEVADLFGVRLATVSELEAGEKFLEARFKKLTGGDRMKGRRMRQDFFDWDPTHAFVMAGNERPEVRGDDKAFWRRMRVVPFDVVIPHDEQQDDLAAMVVREHGHCVLAWLVRGMRDLTTRGFSEPATVLVATEEYRQESDHVGQFLSDRATRVPGAVTRHADLRDAYHAWCLGEAVAPLRDKAFRQAVKNSGWVHDKVWTGEAEVRGWRDLSTLSTVSTPVSL